MEILAAPVPQTRRKPSPLAGEGREGGRRESDRPRCPSTSPPGPATGRRHPNAPRPHLVMNTSPFGMFWNAASGTEKLLASSDFGLDASHCVSEISS